MLQNKLKTKNMIIFIISVVLLTAIDQVTKIAATAALKGNEPFVIIDGVFEFFYLENTGTAWGMFGGATTFFIILTVLIVAVLVYIVIKLPSDAKYKPMYVIINLLIAGAIGNFIDRVMLSYVRDFIYFKLIDFPIFNCADIYVTVGMFLFAFFVLFKYDEEDLTFLKGKKNE